MFWEPLIHFDQTVVTYFHLHQTFLWHAVFSLLTFLGQWWFILGSAIILVIIFTRNGHYRQLFSLLLGTLGTEATVLFIKMLAHRSRPLYYSYTPFEHFASFPSGHAALSVSFYGFLLYLIVKRETDAVMRALYTTTGIFFIVMIGFSRIYLGRHYPSDVLAGFFIGSAFLFIAIWITEGRLPTKISNFFTPIQNAHQKKKLHHKGKSR